MSQPETYPVPLDRLHALGLDETEQPANVDYPALGIGPDDIPALICIATDRRYDTAMLPVAWSPLHAWRALGTLRAVEAIQPLMALLDRAEDDDWILEEVPRALGLIGAPAIPIVARHLAHDERPVWSRIAAATALAHIAKTYPDVRADCVNALTEQLRLFEKQDPELNAFLVSGLLDLRAVESASIIEAAFAADQIDISITGDWEDVQVELGLLPARLTLPRRYASFLSDGQWPEPSEPAARPHATRERRAAEKRRRKIAKQSRRRNRRRR